MLSRSHGRNVLPRHKGIVIWATFFKYPARVEREIIFWTHGGNVSVVLWKKSYSGRMAEVLYTDCKCHSTFCTWLTYCRHVAVDYNCLRRIFTVSKCNDTFATFLQRPRNKSWYLEFGLRRKSVHKCSRPAGAMSFLIPSELAVEH